MKRLFFILFLILGIHSAQAECSMSGMRFYPIQKEIGLNSLFILEGYAMSQKTVVSFKDRKIYLESDKGEEVELELLEVYEGQMNLTQAVFRPKSKLKPNTLYSPKYENETERESLEMKRWNDEIKQNEKVEWRTSSRAKVSKLNRKLGLEFIKNELNHYGCGPASYAVFDIINADESEAWFKTEVVEIETNTLTTFYLVERMGNVEVGHGMCSGGFKFKDSHQYKVRFTAMNSDGDSLETTDWVEFDSPYQKMKNPFF